MDTLVNIVIASMFIHNYVKMNDQFEKALDK